jgi:hypothetical protein
MYTGQLLEMRTWLRCNSTQHHTALLRRGSAHAEAGAAKGGKFGPQGRARPFRVNGDHDGDHAGRGGAGTERAEVRVETVDNFQGEEADIVILSWCVAAHRRRCRAQVSLWLPWFLPAASRCERLPLQGWGDCVSALRVSAS